MADSPLPEADVLHSREHKLSTSDMIITWRAMSNRLTFTRLSWQVAKDPESGITHYISIIVAHNEGKNGAKDPDATTPVPLPKLPVNLDDVPTARQVNLPIDEMLWHLRGNAAAAQFHTQPD